MDNCQEAQEAASVSAMAVGTIANPYIMYMYIGAAGYYPDANTYAFGTMCCSWGWSDHT